MAKSRDCSKSKLTCLFDEDKLEEEETSDQQESSGEAQELKSPLTEQQANDQKAAPSPSSRPPRVKSLSDAGAFELYTKSPICSSDGSLGSEQKKRSKSSSLRRLTS
jgi:hypothetical protein